MAHGYPDYFSPVIPSMPTIGAGQVAWYQSAAKEVPLGSYEDLINYVVPDNMELHVCSGVVSGDFPCHQRYKLVTTPAATWVSPTSHIDPDIYWAHAEAAYDGDTATRTQSGASAGDWGKFFILLLNEVYIDKIKFYATYEAGAIDKIDVDVYYAGGWHHVDEAAFTHQEWVEWDIPAGASLVSKARVRFYNSAATSQIISLFEFMFNTSGEAPQESIYFDTHTIIPYLPQAPYLVPSGATFTVRVYNDDDAAHTMTVNIAGFLQTKV